MLSFLAGMYYNSPASTTNKDNYKDKKQVINASKLFKATPSNFKVSNPNRNDRHKKFVQNWSTKYNVKYGGKGDNYDIQVDTSLIEAFGQPHNLTLRSTGRHSNPNSMMDKLNDYTDYPFQLSIEGTLNYFLSNETAYNSTQSSHNTKELLIQSLGLNNQSLGKVESIFKTIQEESDLGRLESHDMYFSSGAVAQYILGFPKNFNGKLIIAIHGCKSSPDKVMGLGLPDYSNKFGRIAFENGYLVVAPYSIDICKWTDDFDALGALSSGITSYGYELLKLDAILNEVENLFPNISEKIIWGISIGGQLAAYSAALNHEYDKVVISGSFYDIREYLRADILPLLSCARTHYFYDLWSKVTLGDIVKSIFPREVIISFGSYDKSPNIVEMISDLKKAVNNNYPNKSDFLKINFFQGFHEADPEGVLELLN